MINAFEFKGCNPDKIMETEADAVIEEILNSASTNVKIVALMSFDGKKYNCSIDIYQRDNTISTSINDANFSNALSRAKEIILKKLSIRKSEILTNKFKNTFKLLKHTYY